jgi:hypothetical protein
MFDQQSWVGGIGQKLADRVRVQMEQDMCTSRSTPAFILHGVQFLRAGFLATSTQISFGV